jgi:hypothetical protein
MTGEAGPLASLNEQVENAAADLDVGADRVERLQR